jgi:hypothetical protein
MGWSLGIEGAVSRRRSPDNRQSFVSIVETLRNACAARDTAIFDKNHS